MGSGREHRSQNRVSGPSLEPGSRPSLKQGPHLEARGRDGTGSGAGSLLAPQVSPSSPAAPPPFPSSLHSSSIKEAPVFSSYSLLPTLGETLLIQRLRIFGELKFG